MRTLAVASSLHRQRCGCRSKNIRDSISSQDSLVTSNGLNNILYLLSCFYTQSLLQPGCSVSSLNRVSVLVCSCNVLLGTPYSRGALFMGVPFFTASMEVNIASFFASQVLMTTKLEGLTLSAASFFFESC